LEAYAEPHIPTHPVRPVSVIPYDCPVVVATLPVVILIPRHSLAIFKVLNQVFLTPAGELVLIDKPRPMQMNGVDGAEHIVEPVAVKHCVHNRVIDENGLDGFISSPAVLGFKPFKGVLCHISLIDYFGIAVLVLKDKSAIFFLRFNGVGELAKKISRVKLIAPNVDSNVLSHSVVVF
jgi:hypothetical protein